MAWYDEKNRTSYVAEYKDAKAIDRDANRAGPKGWTIVSTTGEDGKVRVMGTMAKGALTGGVGLLLFGRSRKHGKIIVSWQRMPSGAAAEMPARPDRAVVGEHVLPVTVDHDQRNRQAQNVLWAGKVRYLGGHPKRLAPDSALALTHLTLRSDSIHAYKGETEGASTLFVVRAADVQQWTIQKQRVSAWQRDTKVLVLAVAGPEGTFKVSFQLPLLKSLGDVGSLENALSLLSHHADDSAQTLIF